MHRSYALYLSRVLALALLVFVSTSRALAAEGEAPVNVNSASSGELEAVKGIGDATATKIISNRPYGSLDDLGKAGLSAKKIEKLRPYLTVGGGAPSAAAPAVPAPKAKSAGQAKAAEAASPTAAAGPVDINIADQATLETLPGVGPALAKNIIESRPYASVDDLSKVKGIGAAKLAALKDKVVVGAAAAARAPAAPARVPAAPAPVAPATAKSAASSASTASAKLEPGQKVSLNHASLAELESVPGIGPKKAQAIIDGRPYKAIEDVMSVKGIKQGIFGKIKDHITVN